MQRAFGIDLEIPDDFGHWLAGLTDGEGAFIVSIQERRTCRILQLIYAIHLRADDAPMLREIKGVLRVGSIHYAERGSRNPMAQYSVHRNSDLFHVIVPLFRKFPLRSKKARDFETWAELVKIHHAYSKARGGLGSKGGRDRLPQEFWGTILPLVDKLREGRNFSREEMG